MLGVVNRQIPTPSLSEKQATVCGGFNHLHDRQAGAETEPPLEEIMVTQNLHRTFHRNSCHVRYPTGSMPKKPRQGMDPQEQWNEVGIRKALWRLRLFKSSLSRRSQIDNRKQFVETLTVVLLVSSLTLFLLFEVQTLSEHQDGLLSEFLARVDLGRYCNRDS